jgi:hypothetical protein
MWRRIAVLVVGCAALASWGTAAVEAEPDRPPLTFAANVPGDVQALASTTWRRFVDAFPAARGCLAPVALTSALELDDRAVYDPDRHVISVRIPGTAPNLEASLVHEFAHHLEFTCPALHSIRGPFLAAQDLPAASAWFEAPTWETIPSEQFAEATIEAVLGRRPAHVRILITPEAVEVIRAWARGD